MRVIAKNLSPDSTLVEKVLIPHGVFHFTNFVLYDALPYDFAICFHLHSYEQHYALGNSCDDIFNTRDTSYIIH